MLVRPQEYMGQPGEFFECDICGMEDIQYGMTQQVLPLFMPAEVTGPTNPLQIGVFTTARSVETGMRA